MVKSLLLAWFGALLLPAAASAASLHFSFSGLTDERGFRLDGALVPSGLPFDVVVTIDDTNAAAATYDVLAVRGSIGGTPFTTSGPWDIPDLVAVQEMGAVLLTNWGIGEFPVNSAGESFGVDARAVGPGVLATEPRTWTGLMEAGTLFDPALPPAETVIYAYSDDFTVATHEPFRGQLFLRAPEPRAWLLVLMGLGALAHRRRALLTWPRPQTSRWR